MCIGKMHCKMTKMKGMWLVAKGTVLYILHTIHFTGS